MSATILVVEDEPLVMTLTRTVLSSAGYDVLEATTGAAAIALLDELRPDGLLLDLRLPDIDGWEVLTHVRSRSDLAGLPVVMFSAHAQQEVQDRARAAGCGWVQKPFRRDVLLDAIAASLA